MKILITGATRGIGRGLLFKYLDKAEKVYLVARNKEELVKLKSISKKIEIFDVDLSDINKVKELSLKLKDIDFDLIILNAGVSIGHSKSWVAYDEFEKLFKVNFLSIHALLENIIPSLKDTKIVFISSLASITASPTSTAYSASKRALNSYIESLRAAYPNLKVINILPGFIDTDMTKKNNFKMPFFMSYEEGIDRIYEAIERNKFYYPFPKRFYYLLKLFNLLPFSLQSKILNKFI